VKPPLGQHFLRDPSVVKTILAAAELEPRDCALEIGPGKGALTGDLLGRVHYLTVIELDNALAKDLGHRYKDCSRFQVIQGDFLKTNLDTLFSPARLPIKILGNLPYSITSPIFEKIMPWPGWNTGVFLVQREVAERMAAPPGSRTYGILTLAVRLYAEVETILQVKPGAFAPPPKVSSSVIRLRRKKAAEIAPELTPPFFNLVHGAFAHRRKTIANSLAFFTRLSRATIEKWLAAQSVASGARAETLDLQDYVRLANAWSIFRREMNLT
jgi:16S rRNA (adenine1518-N6/adenine1519-N6)-dimethyltransferase